MCICGLIIKIYGKIVNICNILMVKSCFVSNEINFIIDGENIYGVIFENIVFVMIYLIIVFFGVIGNSIVIVIVCKMLLMYIIMNYLLVNLVLFDLLLLLFCLGFYDFFLYNVRLS